MLGQSAPGLAAVGRAVDLSGLGAEVESQRLSAILTQGLPEDGEVGTPLGQPLRQRLPAATTIPGAIDPQLALGRHAIGVGREWDHECAIRIVWVNGEWKAEVRGET